MKEYIRQYVASRVLNILKRLTQNASVSIRRVQIQHGLLRVWGMQPGLLFDHDFLVRFSLSVNSCSWWVYMNLEYADVDNILWGTDGMMVSTALAVSINNSKRIKYSLRGRQLDVYIGDVMTKIKRWFVGAIVVIAVVGALPCICINLTMVGFVLCGCLVALVESLLCSAYFSLRKFIAGGF